MGRCQRKEQHDEKRNMIQMQATRPYLRPRSSLRIAKFDAPHTGHRHGINEPSLIFGRARQSKRPGTSHGCTQHYNRQIHLRSQLQWERKHAASPSPLWPKLLAFPASPPLGIRASVPKSMTRPLLWPLRTGAPVATGLAGPAGPLRTAARRRVPRGAPGSQ